MTVFVIEFGSEVGIRPARLLRRYTSTADGEAGERAVVEFTDLRGGRRDCFARSVWPTAAAAQAASRQQDAQWEAAQAARRAEAAQRTTPPGKIARRPPPVAPSGSLRRREPSPETLARLGW